MYAIFNSRLPFPLSLVKLSFCLLLDLDVYHLLSIPGLKVSAQKSGSWLTLVVLDTHPSTPVSPPAFYPGVISHVNGLKWIKMGSRIFHMEMDHLAAVLGVDHCELAVLVDVHPDVLHRLLTVVVDADVNGQIFSVAVYLHVVIC